MGKRWSKEEGLYSVLTLIPISLAFHVITYTLFGPAYSHIYTYKAQGYMEGKSSFSLVVSQLM